MNDDPNGTKLAARALERGMITAEQHQVALEQQKAMGGYYHLGALLVSKGFLAESDLQALLKEPTNAPPPPPKPAPPKPAPATRSTPSTAQPAARVTSPSPAAHRPAKPATGLSIDLDDELSSFLASVGVKESAPPASEPARPAARPMPEPAPASSPAPSSSTSTSTARHAPDPFASTHAPSPRSPSASTVAALKALDAHLAYALQRGASDLHLHPGQPVQVRLGGELVAKDKVALDAETLEKLLLPAIPDSVRPRFDRTKDADFTYVAHDGQRARTNIYRSQRGLAGVFRLVPKRIPSLAELGLPESIAKFTHFHSGLLLVTGPSASGKTTTLNALVDQINRERDDHILTIEDPIEYVHESKRCLVNQRQVHRDTKDFSRALKGALREDPDIIVIGELRDHETISLAITAAETGHLVLGSLHTAYATRTIMRMLDVFPAGERAQVRSMLSESLRAIVAQKLLPGVDQKLHVASEVMVMTPAIANLIRDDKMHQLQGAMQMSRQLGSRLMDDSIRELVAKKVVSADVARQHMIQGGPGSSADVGSSLPRPL